MELVFLVVGIGSALILLVVAVLAVMAAVNGRDEYDDGHESILILPPDDDWENRHG